MWRKFPYWNENIYFFELNSDSCFCDERTVWADYPSLSLLNRERIHGLSFLLGQWSTRDTGSTSPAWSPILLWPWSSQWVQPPQIPPPGVRLRNSLAWGERHVKSTTPTWLLSMNSPCVQPGSERRPPSWNTKVYDTLPFAPVTISLDPKTHSFLSWNPLVVGWVRPPYGSPWLHTHIPNIYTHLIYTHTPNTQTLNIDTQYIHTSVHAHTHTIFILFKRVCLCSCPPLTPPPDDLSVISPRFWGHFSGVWHCNSEIFLRPSPGHCNAVRKEWSFQW